MCRLVPGHCSWPANSSGPLQIIQSHLLGRGGSYRVVWPMFRDVVNLLGCMTWIRVGACCIVVCNFRATPCRVILFRLVFWIGSVRIQTIQIHCKSVRLFRFIFEMCDGPVRVRLFLYRFVFARVGFTYLIHAVGYRMPRFIPHPDFRVVPGCVLRVPVRFVMVYVFALCTFLFVVLWCWFVLDSVTVRVGPKNI